MSLKQGQHVRLRAKYTGETGELVANSLDLSFHISNSLEDSSTKDTTDTNGLWLEYEKMKYAVDGSVTAIVTTGSDSGGMTIDEIKAAFMTEAFAWELLFVQGEQNRTSVGVICQGSKMTFSSVEVSGPKDGYAQVTANFQCFSGITVPST